jgi:predicted Rossmann fold flavoprotein
LTSPKESGSSSVIHSVNVPEKIAIIGGGAAGFFAAIACAQANPKNEVCIFERNSHFLTKVRISGGGRCNVTHACFEPRDLSASYPRGARALISPFHRFSTTDTVEWFESRGVRLKVEPDGRMFPVTDSSDTIIDCLVEEARRVGVKLFTRKGLQNARVPPEGGFELDLDGDTIRCDRLLLATGGCRVAGSAALLRSLGHTVVPPVPSLFSFHVPTTWIHRLPGIAVNDAEVSVKDTPLREHGPLLITHNGVSGPVILRLSAWGARVLHSLDYRFLIKVNWLPDLSEDAIRAEFQSSRESYPNRRVLGSAIGMLPARLWEQLAIEAGIGEETKWTTLSREQANTLSRSLHGTELEVNGKSLNKEEFVTCGGVDLREINLKTMESRITPRLYVAGELLDVDGITGGFNFQAAWTSGWIAGHAMAGAEPPL